jgi:hypothetical protein
MLAGALRTDPFRQATQRSLLELPVTAERTLLDHWRRCWSALAEDMGWPRLPVRLMVDHSLPLTSAVMREGAVELNIEQDPFAYRGPGGLLSDLAATYDDDDYLLVVTSSQLLSEPLGPIVEALAERGADVAMLAQPDGAPAGMMLIRCRTLREVSPVGFVDFNEQVLPRLAEHWSVRVVHWSQFTGPMIRTSRSYLDALRTYHRRRGQQPSDVLAQDEDWYTTFALVEAGATVPSSACVHDSVVLGGAQVGEQAIIVRSVVCPGAVIDPGDVHIDGVVRQTRRIAIAMR